MNKFQSNFFLTYNPAINFSSSEFMKEVDDDSIDLIITSPPYGQIKDYESDGQIGFGEDFSEYFTRLKRVWKECYRVLTPQRRCCINIGDQYLRARDYERYRVLPIAGKIIQDCTDLGFDFMGDIIWKKVSTTNTTGGCSLMGSLFYPGNGMVTYDYEHILIFKKIEGNTKKISRETKELSKICMDEWKRWYVGHWIFPGTPQKEHIAMFPEELPYRLIRMFSFLNDIVLDPFAGSGTTLKVARNYGRKSLGYEINEEYIPIINKKINEQYTQRDYHSIIRYLYVKKSKFDYRFSTQKSIICMQDDVGKVVVDFMKGTNGCSKTELKSLYDNKLQENNITHFLSGNETWKDISKFIIVVDCNDAEDLSYVYEKHGKKVEFIPYTDFIN